MPLRVVPTAPRKDCFDLNSDRSAVNSGILMVLSPPRLRTSNGLVGHFDRRMSAGGRVVNVGHRAIVTADLDYARLRTLHQGAHVVRQTG